MEPGLVSEKDHVINLFDEILFKHLERLIGSRYGVGELSMNSVTLTLIMLLVERENEIESFPSDNIDRYKKETLIIDFGELGFDAFSDVNIVVGEMIRKDYIHIVDGKLIPQKPTISMARLIDLVFPKMPGMNLVAYFVQIMDEVRSERKDLYSAANQFDQVLQMQSVPLKKETKQSAILTTPGRSADSEKNGKSTTILGRKSSDNFPDHSKDFFTEPKVLSSDVYKGKIKIKKVDFGKPDFKNIEPDGKLSGEPKHNRDEESKKQIKSSETEPHDDDQSTDSGTKMITSSEESENAFFDEQNPRMDTSITGTAILDSAVSDEETLQELKPTELDERIVDQNKDDLSTAASIQVNNIDIKEADENDSEDRQEKEYSSINDDDIKQRITAFEEDLALECPICKQSKVMMEHTVMGKPYYRCSNKDCSFISWGKPHHILCPKCSNPFLIEASNKAGKTVLKCPRATCRYWKKALLDIGDAHQDSNKSTSLKSSKVTSISRKPRRKVVRRRVVRRKK
jgi:hypothetical protein